MTPTSSFPYQSQGPIDFSRLNFVFTEQVEHLNASGVLQSVEIRQTYDPVQVFWTLTGFFFIVICLLMGITYFIAKRSKGIGKSFRFMEN